MMELKRNQSVAAYLSARNDAFAKKEKKFPNSPSSPKVLVGLGFCPGERAHKGITIVLTLFRSHWLAVLFGPLKRPIGSIYTKLFVRLGLHFYCDYVDQ